MSKTVLITGASRGIGRACAVAFAENGYNVIINYKNNKEKALETLELCKKAGAECEIFCCDVSDEQQVVSMFDYCRQLYGGADVLINNAGVSCDGLFSDFKVSDYQRVFDTNILGMMLCAREAERQMLRKGRGRIINIASMWGITGASCEVIYSASKAAVIGFTKALAKEVGLSHINVNCIAPGVIDTDMNSCYDAKTMDSLKEETPVGRIGLPEDVASAALYLADERSSFVTGAVINVSGGFVV